MGRFSKGTVGLGLLALVALTHAQGDGRLAERAAAASAPPPPADGQPIPAILGMIDDRVEGAESINGDFCRLQSTKALTPRSLVVVVRKAPCVSKYGASFNKDLLEVLYRGKLLLVESSDVTMTDADTAKFAGLTPELVSANLDDWKVTSLKAWRHQLMKALNALEATSKHGVALLKATVYDVSEYTEGTGFEATVYNSGKKTIKYVTFNVVGLNAVGDPVRAGLSSGTTAVLRGIGPIEPESSASYSKDYLWRTDVVQTYRLASIKLEFMDGTSRVVTDARAIRIGKQDADMLESDSR